MNANSRIQQSKNPFANKTDMKSNKDKYQPSKFCLDWPVILVVKTQKEGFPLLINKSILSYLLSLYKNGKRSFIILGERLNLGRSFLIFKHNTAIQYFKSQFKLENQFYL